ncbi:diaminopimelate decarboxylase [Oscillospiraceae bacterium]|nr:diaminopimelate decarboxylase [Oscillospiraceae bacterium]BDF76689.1 diaminopimelate decarboxylase [Oscillospiraceae bacterium]
MTKQIRNNTLYFDGCDARALAKKYGTPLYVFSETDMASRFAELRKAFLSKWENTRVAYACKAFCCTAMLKLCEREGVCIDVVSGGELYAAIKSGFPADRIEFNGNNKLPSELELAVEYGIGRIIIDSPQELKLIEGICAAKSRKMNVLYRITPGIKVDTHDYIVTGKKDSKFGFPLDDDVILPAVEAAIRSRYVNLMGFHFHIGSQLHARDGYLKALEVMLKLVRDARAQFAFETKELNVGGGFGITYTNEERKPYAYYLDPIMERMESFFRDLGVKRPNVVIEPGRSIVGEAGMSLYTVGAIKDIKGVRKYVSVDGGMTDNIRPALYQAVYTGILANRAEERAAETVTVCGKCCESGDVLVRDIALPEAKPGDLFAMFSTGAYGYSMASNYNLNPLPAVVLVREGRDELIVRRQSYDDMLQNNLIPDSLREQDEVV